MQTSHTAELDILIPTYCRPACLAATLTSLIAQTFHDFRVIISDQTPDEDMAASPLVTAIIDILKLHQHPVEIHKHLPRRGLAEQRQFLLNQATAPFILYLDDDVILEANALEVMLQTIKTEQCGFVGCAVPSPRYLDDVRPQHQHIEFWESRVQPEVIQLDSPEWHRVSLHSAANILHVAQKLKLSPQEPRPYKVSWVGGCVLFDTHKLRQCGGFSFWEDLPPKHSGEDVLAQIRVMARHGGCGLIPTRAYHLALETTVPNREVDAPYILPLHVHAD